MLTNKERIKALICNLKNYDWDIFPVYRLEREDALALYELLTRQAAAARTKGNIST